MKNSEKIKILKQNIVKLINNTKNTDEEFLFNFAKIQRKEMQIEISKGEIKGLINNILFELNHEKLINYDSFTEFLDEANPINNDFYNQYKSLFNDLI